MSYGTYKNAILLALLLPACTKVKTADLMKAVTATNAPAPIVKTNTLPPMPPLRSTRKAMVALDAPTSTGHSVGLAWDAATDPTVVGYHVYWGQASRVYTNMVDVGMSTSLTVSNLTVGDVYYFAATTYNAAGLESQFSQEIAWMVGAQVLTNAVQAFGQVLSSTNPNGPWTVLASFPAVTVTNPPGAMYFRTAMSIQDTNVAQQVLKLDTSTLVITNQ